MIYLQLSNLLFRLDQRVKLGHEVEKSQADLHDMLALRRFHQILLHVVDSRALGKRLLEDVARDIEIATRVAALNLSDPVS